MGERRWVKSVGEKPVGEKHMVEQSVGEKCDHG